ncbi:NAD(P)H-dependent oxidoreductase [Crocinitomix sp.]|nr:NAD(P)H-dependent oxidoreductase [Crocinitomix sp.]
MRVIAFAGSSSKNSINKKLAGYALSCFEDVDTELLDINNFEAPLYSIDREKEFGVPALIQAFGNKIDQADLILISVAEHNGNYPAAFKNLYDWVSRIPERKVFNNTPVFLMSTSPGARGGASSMEFATNRFPRDGAKILDTFSLPNFNDNFSDERIIENELRAIFHNKIDTIKAYFIDAGV